MGRSKNLTFRILIPSYEYSRPDSEGLSYGGTMMLMIFPDFAKLFAIGNILKVTVPFG